MLTVIDWMTRCVRRYRLDGNELRRRSDRLETAALLVALSVIALSVWPAAALGRLAYADGLAAERTGPGVRELVTATLVQDAPASGAVMGEGAPKVTAMARWRTSAGAQVTGEVSVLPGAGAGAVTRVWVGGDGRVTAAPKHRLESVTRAVAAGAAVLAGVTGVMTLCLLSCRVVLDRGRYAEWEAAWIREFERGPHQGEPS
ncbi:hypothetical protein ACFFMN_39385 [Planobispora siamensis]|uniref:Uncharacterized protein n=1 Tax=Planobispora siamensis TaxID=936338 RepID=A0A8J3WQ03_9ACTN|nr:hypothetical protein [Planobispora siamensis]GIH96272.1 hypothetical protein Psi01_69020 [Planobispora siamensis]